MEIFEYDDFPEVNYKKSPKKDYSRWCKGIVGREHVVKYTGSYWQLGCVKCNTRLSKMAPVVRCRYDGEFARQYALEQKWCQEGHLYDWVIVEDECWNYRPALYRRRMCLMCGKVSKSKYLGLK